MITEVLNHLPSELPPEIEQLRQILGAVLVNKILNNQIGIDLSDGHEEGEYMDGPSVVRNVPLMLGTAWRRLLWSSTAWQ